MQITSNKFRLRVIEQLISIMQMARPENGRHTLGPGYLFIVLFTTQGVRGEGCLSGPTIPVAVPLVCTIPK